MTPITVTLKPETAAALSAMAESMGVARTSLMRTIMEEGVDALKELG